MNTLYVSISLSLSILHPSFCGSCFLFFDILRVTFLFIIFNFQYELFWMQSISVLEVKLPYDSVCPYVGGW